MGVALETVTVQHERSKKPRQVRISPNVRLAIDHMVDDARSRAEAAKIAGITDDALYRALCKPEVLAYRNSRMRVIRTSETARSLKRVADLADQARSESVKLEANRFLLSTDPDDPIIPTQRHENTHRFPDGAPGLTIVMQAAPVGVLIDSQSNERELPNGLRHLPHPVPHPSMRNAQIAQHKGESSGEILTAENEPEGQKSRPVAGRG